MSLHSDKRGEGRCAVLSAEWALCEWQQHHGRPPAVPEGTCTSLPHAACASPSPTVPHEAARQHEAQWEKCASDYESESLPLPGRLRVPLTRSGPLWAARRTGPRGAASSLRNCAKPPSQRARGWATGTGPAGRRRGWDDALGPGPAEKRPADRRPWLAGCTTATRRWPDPSAPAVNGARSDVRHGRAICKGRCKMGGGRVLRCCLLMIDRDESCKSCWQGLNPVPSGSTLGASLWWHATYPTENVTMTGKPSETIRCYKLAVVDVPATTVRHIANAGHATCALHHSRRKTRHRRARMSRLGTIAQGARKGLGSPELGLGRQAAVPLVVCVPIRRHHHDWHVPCRTTCGDQGLTARPPASADPGEERDSYGSGNFGL
jgi:hypothetical protein